VSTPRLTLADVQGWPALVGPAEMCGLWGIGRSQFHRLDRRGAFDAFKVTPAIGPKCFSTEILARYLAGDPVAGAAFGRITHRVQQAANRRARHGSHRSGVDPLASIHNECA
jgi:hypothetical protein